MILCFFFKSLELGLVKYQAQYFDKFVSKLRMVLTKKCAPKLLFFIEKKRKIQMIFVVENSLIVKMHLREKKKDFNLHNQSHVNMTSYPWIQETVFVVVISNFTRVSIKRLLSAPDKIMF